MILYVVCVVLQISLLTTGLSNHKWFRRMRDNIYSTFDVSGYHTVRQSSNGCNVICGGKQCQCSGQDCHSVPSFVDSNIFMLSIQETNINELANGTFSQFKILIHLEILQNRISAVKSYAFKGLSALEILDMGSNGIEVLDPEAFAGLGKLKDLNLVQNKLKDINAVTLSIGSTILPSLEFLNLAANSFNEISKNSFEPLNTSEVKYLELRYCGLSNIHPEAFLPLTKLEGLHLHGNDQLNSTVLQPIFEVFKKMAIKKLGLGKLGFSHIPTELIKTLSMTSVTEFHLGGYEFSEIKNNQFPLYEKLEALYLNKNYIGSIEPHAFDNLTGLKLIELKRNRLYTFPEALLLPHLEVIQLEGFKKQSLRFEIPDGIFSNMSGLRVLHLTSKSFLDIKNLTFFGLSGLNELILKNCGIQHIATGSFASLISLKRLDLSNNLVFSLEGYEKPAFQEFRLLEELIVSMSQLGDKHVRDITSSLYNITSLDLSSNGIININSLMIESMPYLKQLNLSNNQINEWDYSLFSNESSLTLLDISLNDITAINPTMVEDFKKVLYLNISTNPFGCNCNILPFLKWANVTNSTIHDFWTDSGSYICETPTDLRYTYILKVQSFLTSECDNNKGAYIFTILIAAAALLMLILVAVFVTHIYRKVSRHTSLIIHPIKFQYDAFVSYSTIDSEWVLNTLLPQLENGTSSLKLCVYDRDFIAGREITDCIIDSIKCSRKVILILSNNFIKSPWCKFETDLAHHLLLNDNRDGLILIRLENLKLEEISSKLNYLLQTRIYLEWSKDPKLQNLFWKKLKKALSNPKASSKIRSAFFV